MLSVRVRGTPKLRAGPPPLEDEGPALAQRVRLHPPSVVSRDDVRKRLMVPKVNISSVVIPFREDDTEWGDGSFELVGVSEAEDEADEEFELRLNERKNEIPLDLGNNVEGVGEVVEDVDEGFLSGGSETGIAAGELGSELEASLLLAVVMEPGVVEPEGEASLGSLLRFEERRQMTVVESWGRAWARIAGEAGGGTAEICVASRPSGIGSSSPSSVMRTARRGSGSGAKRIFLDGWAED